MKCRNTADSARNTLFTKKQNSEGGTNGKGQQKKNRFPRLLQGSENGNEKVVWPTKKELVSYTSVVILTCAVFALGFWLIDTGVLAALRAVLG